MTVESRVFVAEFFGRCEVCGQNIEPGEDVLYVDGILCHARDDLWRGTVEARS